LALSVLRKSRGFAETPFGGGSAIFVRHLNHHENSIAYICGLLFDSFGLRTESRQADMKSAVKTHFTRQCSQRKNPLAAPTTVRT
jgi:hypothetical protein